MMDIKRQNESTVENDKGEETGLVQSQTNKMVTHNARDNQSALLVCSRIGFQGTYRYSNQ